jgi:multiple antibiotic resistance protein
VAQEKEDVSITPLAIPLLAGPGAITAVMLFTNQYGGATGATIVVTALLVVMAISWLFLRYSEWFQKVIGPIGMKVVGRVMGLVLTFIAAQHFLNGLENAGLLP